MAIFMKLVQFYRQFVQLDINLLETSRKLLSHVLNFLFESVEYVVATIWKCLSNGKWNTTEILCNLTEPRDPENTQKLKLKKLLLKSCFILSGLRKSYKQGSADQIIEHKNHTVWSILYTVMSYGPYKMGHIFAQNNLNKFLCFCYILDFVIPITVSS